MQMAWMATHMEAPMQGTSESEPPRPRTPGPVRFVYEGAGSVWRMRMRHLDIPRRYAQMKPKRGAGVHSWD